MRLLHIKSDGKLEFTNDIIDKKDIPPYAILSHTWGEQEVTIEDLKSFDCEDDVGATKKAGWEKILFCAQQTKLDGLEYFWVDTCCIDKANNTELSEAINSMFRWYQNANKCYVFLSDVEGKSSDSYASHSSSWKQAFRESRWFSRGWTLQELLAPRAVEFFSKDGVLLGDKASLGQTIHEVTKIPIQALLGIQLSRLSVDERLSWAQDRQTTREEDAAYCLLGIFDCYLPLIYGEGRENALKRLKKEIQEGERLTKICRWLSAPDPSTNYHRAQKQRQAETGQWLLQSESFKEWKNAPASRLWLYGIPGCGKTVLGSTIIEHLLQHCDEESHNVTVYFFFDFNDVQKRDPGLMLRSLLYQLLQRTRIIPEAINASFSASGNGEQPPSLHALLEIAPQVMALFSHVYIVLDALDECTQRPELMGILEILHGWQLDMVHLLMISRKEHDIETSVKTYVGEKQIVCLQKDVVDKDILRYIRQRLREDKRLAKWKSGPLEKDASIIQEIETTLMRGAHGM